MFKDKNKYQVGIKKIIIIYTVLSKHKVKAKFGSALSVYIIMTMTLVIFDFVPILTLLSAKLCFIVFKFAWIATDYHITFLPLSNDLKIFIIYREY